MCAIFKIDFALPNLLTFNDSAFYNIDALTLCSYISHSHYIAHNLYMFMFLHIANWCWWIWIIIEALWKSSIILYVVAILISLTIHV